MAANYQIKKGDCLYCIAREHNLMAETVWNHKNNAQLKIKRRQPNMLAPGDVIFLPDIQPKEVSEATHLVHKFRTKWAKHKHWIEIELIDDDEKPVAGAKYKVILPEGLEQGEPWIRTAGRGSKPLPKARARSPFLNLMKNPGSLSKRLVRKQ